MKTIKFLFLSATLIFAMETGAQTCTASFTYSLTPNGVITFSNLSTPVNPTVPTNYFWDLGNGVTFTTTSLSQTVGTTYTIGSTYNVRLDMQSGALTPTICGNTTVTVISYSMPGCPLSPSMVVSNAGVNTATVNFTSLSTGTTAGTIYTWDFGDGATGSGPSISHTYSVNGIYAYTLTASNNATCSSYISHYLDDYGPAVVCEYTPTISYITAGSAVTFTINGSATASTHAYWDFDGIPCWGIYCDNYTGSRTNPTHTFFNGVYTPTAYVYSSIYCTHTVIAGSAITITNNPCNANSAFTYTAGSGGTVQFTKTAPPPNIGYMWYFGDGVFSTLVNPSHTYASAGNYTVMLRAFDLTYPITDPYDSTYVSMPCRTNASVNLNITGIPCLANASFSIMPSGIPQNYWLSMAQPYNIASASWDWGDGSTSSVLYPSHTYSAAGNYNICLTLTTTCGTTASMCVNQYLSRSAAGMIFVQVQAPGLSDAVEELQNMVPFTHLFPNPLSDGQLNIQLSKEVESGELAVYDLLGMEVYRMAIPPREQQFKTDVSQLQNGVYFLRLRTQNDVRDTKLIISK